MVPYVWGEEGGGGRGGRLRQASKRRRGRGSPFSLSLGLDVKAAAQSLAENNDPANYGEYD